MHKGLCRNGKSTTHTKHNKRKQKLWFEANILFKFCSFSFWCVEKASSRQISWTAKVAGLNKHINQCHIIHLKASTFLHNKTNKQKTHKILIWYHVQHTMEFKEYLCRELILSLILTWCKLAIVVTLLQCLAFFNSDFVVVQETISIKNIYKWHLHHCLTFWSALFHF